MWAYLLSLLTSWSADPAAIDQEHPRAAAAVAYAYVAMAPAREPAPEKKSTVERSNFDGQP